MTRYRTLRDCVLGSEGLSAEHREFSGMTSGQLAHPGNSINTSKSRIQANLAIRHRQPARTLFVVQCDRFVVPVPHIVPKRRTFGEYTPLDGCSDGYVSGRAVCWDRYVCQALTARATLASLDVD